MKRVITSLVAVTLLASAVVFLAAPANATSGSGPSTGEAVDLPGAARSSEYAPVDVRHGWLWYRNAGTGKCMNIPGGSTAWGANVTQFRCGSWPDHYWSMEHREGPYFWIRNKKSGLCLAVPGGSTSPNVQLIQWPCDPRWLDHYWRTQEFTNGTRIINRRSGQCVAVRGGSGADNAPVIQFPCGSWADHFWLFG